MLRSLRTANQQAFDRAWEPLQASMPVWLEHPIGDGTVAGMLIAWVNTPDWPSSRSYLLDNAVALLTDAAEATLEHLRDANPAAVSLDEHLNLLQVSRARGIEDAYETHNQQRVLAQLFNALSEWIATRTWEASQSFATAHEEELLHPETLALLDAIGDQDPGDTVIRFHRGLLHYSTAYGFDMAYDLRESPTKRRTGLVALRESPSTELLLALARLHSGQSSNDAEAHFELACVSALAGNTDEAKAALVDCAENAAPFEKRDFIRRLDQRVCRGSWL